MKGLKRILAMLLAVVMVVGLIPATVFAADDSTDYLFLATDRHTNASIIGKVINNMETYIGENKLDYLGLGGDMVGSGDSHPAYNSSTVLSEVTGATSSLSATNVDIVAGIHDMNVTDDASIVLPYQGGGAQIYVGDKFYVYGVEEYCISDDSKESNWSSEAQKFVDWANGDDIDTSKVIIVLSHYPLHAKRDDNDGAYYWHQALNTVATGSASGTEVTRNVFFFHGHNHTVDSNEYVYNVGDTMSIQNGSSTTSGTLYYTYATAGYLNQNSNATLMTITDDAVTLTKYGTSGSGAAMTSVKRVSTTPTLSSIAISGTTEYTVGDKLALTVTATYSDGSTADVTSSATLTGYDLSTAGTQTVTATYEGKTATTSITVSKPTTLTSIEVTGETEYTVGGNGLKLTVTATYDDGTTADVTAEATFSPAELTASGEYTVTATYGGLTDTIDVTVNLYDEVLAADGESLLMGVEAFSQGATALEVTWDDAADAVLEAEGLYTDYVVYDLALTNPGETTTYSMTLSANMDTTNLAVYHVADDGTLTAVPCTIENDCVVFTTSLTGTFAYGSVVVPEGYTAASVTVENTPANMFAGDSLDMTDAVITVTYTKADAEDFIRKLTVYDYDIDALTFVDNGNIRTYTFTFDGVSDTFNVSVWGQDFTASDVTVHVEGEEYGVTNVNVAESTNTNVATAIQYVITGDNYVAYDITLTYADGYSATEDTKTVTLPIPEGVENPVVYYVSANGTVVTDMNATNNGDGTVTFTTTHFSTYVLGDGTVIETESGNATIEGTEDVTTTTKVAEEVTVYKLVTAPVSGKTYLIVNSNTGTGYGLDGDTTGYATTAFTGGSDYYSDWDDTNKTGTAFATGSDVYLTTSGAYLWTAGSNTFAIGYDSDRSNSIGSTSYTYTLNPAGGTSGTWNLSGNQLSISLVTKDNWLGSDTNTTYYLSGGSTWSMSTTAANVYFYEPVTIYKVTETETTTPGTEGGSYSVDVKNSDVTDAVAIKGQTVTLTSKLNFTGATSGTVTEVTDWDVTYTLVEDKGNPAVISSIDGTTATLSGTPGTAVVRATYTKGTQTAWAEFIVTATNVADENYTIDLTDGEPNFNSITAPITIKGVTEGQTTSVWAIVKAGDVELGTLGNALSWKVSDTSIASINTTTGVITFTGEEGTVDVTVYYTCPGGKVIEDTVTFSVTVGNYTIPSDGTDDFPEYPEEGAIRFDKHATAVGNFSETGIAQVELSMTGVPYSTGSEIDVVVMLDMTGSMSDDGMEAAEEATKAFVEKIVKNEDGTYNDNRVAVYAFNSGSSSPYELVALTTIKSDTALETANTAIDTASNKQASGGTPYEEATQKCYNVLAAAKTDGTGNNRQQFCVFMSDGGPTTYYGSDEKTYYGGNNNSGDVTIVSKMTNYTSSTASSWSMDLPTEYYTEKMKAAGVTIYTVGLLLQNTPSNPAPWSAMTSVSSVYDSTTDSLTTIGTHYYFTSEILKQMASDESKYIDIFDVDNAANATAKFESIALSIREAATDVSVTDKITEDYTMVFEAPNSTVAAALPTGQEMYIEVKNYVLNPVYTEATGITEFAAGITYYTKGTDGTYTEVTGSFVANTTYFTITDYTRGTSTSLVKLYLGKSGTTYYAASDANGTAYASPTFNQTAIGTKYYWTTTADTASGVSVTVDGTTYYFVAAGISNTDDDYVAANWYNMASGAYAFGNIVTTDILDAEGKDIGDNSTCDDLIIATPHFVYNAKTKMLVWTAEKLSTTELTLTYFLYLDESGGYSGAQGETDPGTYETNEYAHLNYTNFQGTECQQTMPVPQMTWNGAQVSYVFYLVNEAGQPVNRAGRVVPFSEAVYVTDVYTHSIVWNDLEQVASLEAAYLAEELVPDIYDLYDSGATYNIHVFEDEEGQDLNNHFVIGSGKNIYTTYVFNNKSDATKYKDPGAYAAAKTYKCKEYVEGGQHTDDKGAYNIVEKNDATAVETGFDFSNTTVAFAVVWTPELAEDTVVVDFGLDVVIDVVTNDALASGVVGVRADAPSGITMNSGTYDADKVTSVDVYIDANSDEAGLKELKIGTATVENLNSVRFSLDETNGMQFSKPVTFYYESDVNYYAEEDGEMVLNTTSMYSSVTVIPATTVYYEDTFVTYTGTNTAWAVEGTASSKTQDVDRPGARKEVVSSAYDADNVYGYDSAYASVATYSMGAAHKVHVDANSYATATFSFYGTGFDVIGMTSNDTGVLAVKVVDAKGNKVASKVVDTYYGYTMDADGNWTATPDTAAALYQVPVIKVEGLDYAKYTVTITATYMKAFDHTTEDGYDLYLDAIRIYDPTGVASNSVTNDVVSNAYKADGEGWPRYMELRDELLAETDFIDLDSNDNTVFEGAMFIDGIGTLTNTEAEISTYTSYGPNNEVYLAPGQGVAFALSDADHVHVGMRRMTGTATYTIESYDENGNLLKSMTGDVTSATDMYYDITDLKDGTIVIRNSGESGELMITNLKYTFDSDSAAVQLAMFMTLRRSTAVLGALNSVDTDSDKTDDTVTGETETDDTVVEDTTNTETDDTVVEDTTNTENNDTVVEDTNTENDDTVVEDTDTNAPAEDVPEEEIPEEDVPAEEEVTEETTEQLGFWARLWNAIKNAFNRLFSWFGF